MHSQKAWRDLTLLGNRGAWVWALAASLMMVAVGACGTAEGPADSTSTAKPGDVENTDDVAPGADADAAQPDGSSDIATAQDGGPCTADEECADKVTVDPKTCDAPVCKNGKCQVGVSKAKNGKICDDGWECTAADVCTEGKCAGAVKCEEKGATGIVNVCKVGQCDDNGTGKCVFFNGKGACDDGDPCTTEDACQAGGKCKGADKACPDDKNACTIETCNPAKDGACDIASAPTGTGCSDNDFCTAQDTCDGNGKCAGVTVKCVAQGNPCSIEACDTALGCVSKPLNDGQSCDDNNSCYEKDVCVKSVCKGKDIAGIDDDNPCTKDICEGKGLAKPQISHDPAPMEGATCSDGENCTVGDSCSNGACKAAPLVCNDGNPCTQDQCDPNKCVAGGSVCGQCVYLPAKDAAACEDGDKCTAKDSCKLGKCTGIDLLTTGGCDDKNPCTNDNCQPGAGCINVPVDPAKTAFCDDGDPCTEVDKCGGSSCKGTPRDCKDSDPCTNDMCNPKATDIKLACLHELYDGPCDDGDKCTASDLCAGGTCSGAKVICDDKNPCTIDICDTQKGCQYKFAAGGSPCNDGLSCTINDYCDAGQCVAAKDECKPCDSDSYCKQFDDNDVCNGKVMCIDSGGKKGKVCAVDLKSVVKCDPSSDTPCSTNTCNPDNGLCKALLKAEGLQCTSADKCITGAACSATGQCAGKTLSCDDKQDCTVDSCDPAVGCKFVSKADATACDDGTLCTPTEGDKCAKGKCINPLNTCACNSDQECVVYEGKDGDACNEKFKCIAGASGKFCNPVPGTQTVCDTSKDTACVVSTCEKSSGFCKPLTKADLSPCDDGNKCTIGDFCQTGTCKEAKKLNCDDLNPCTDDICDGEFGCASGPKAAGAKCTDNDACTSNDACKNGACVGVKLVCDDGNACTLDLCSKTSGCTNQIDDSLPCDDGDVCSGKDVCKAGVCAGPPLKCDDNDSCTIDACDGQGGCKNIVVEGKDCSDNDACTTADTCKSAKCVGVPKQCSDANECTLDSCKNGACVALAATGTPCDDGNACTNQDACDNNGGCAGKILTCDTSNSCIAYPQGCLPSKGCFSVPNDGKTCSDNDLCTFSDICKGGACTGQSIDCNDGDVCTNDTCDPKKGCLIKQNTCDDANACTTDTCDKVKGCQHVILDGAMCDDGDACTDQTQCNQGKCVGKIVICDDKNTCTGDSCNSAVGCVFLPGEDTAVKCDDKDPCTDDACDVKGVCVGTSKDCDDKNPCTKDSCSPLKGCVYTDADENTVCDDGDACTKDTKCTGGLCAKGTLSCGLCQVDKDCAIFDNNNKCDGGYSCKPSVAGLKACYFNPDPIVCDTVNDSPCKQNKCDTSNGQCAMTELLNGTKCEDSLGCTANDTCANGACKSGPPADCSKSGDACNDAGCQETGKPGGYTCVSLPKAGSPTCDADGNGCTANDFCSVGKCIKGTAIDCTGVAKECQIAACKSTGAVAFQCAVTNVADGGTCDDNQLCTNGDFCKTGKCQAGTTPHDCSEISNICATGTCDKTGNGGLGACIPKPQNDGKDCDSDNNGCTVSDKCNAGGCIPGAPADCQGATTNCAIGACQSTAAATYSCVAAPKKDDLPCEADSNGCTVGDACKTGKCAAGKGLDCSAKNSADGCQLGVCKSTGPSSSFCDIGFALKAVACNSDNNGCTQGDQCNGLGACQPGQAVDCLGITTGCSQGTCKSTGSATYSCQGNAKPDGAVCDADLSGCTKDDKCLAGKCAPGALVDCTDPKATPSQCLAAKCLPSGSTTYQCDNAPLKDNTPCNADKNGCTPNDSCQLGFCEADVTQTCSAVAGLCADASCKSTGDATFSCVAKPKESYPALDPPVNCTPTDKPPICATGYTCTTIDATANIGLCTSPIVIFCDDGNKCSEGDACSGGVCKAGKAKNCDDKDACTLDSCSAGKCINTAIAGCVPCIDELFDDPYPKNWAPLSTDVTFVTWDTSTKKPLTGPANYRSTWKGPSTKTGAPTSEIAKLRSRRIYIGDSAAATLEFYVNMTVGAQNCGFDDLQVRINGIKVWEKCDTSNANNFEPGTSYEKVKLDLSKFAGAPADLEFWIIAGTQADNKGTVDIDSVKLTGACGPGCLAATFEPVNEDPDVAPTDLVFASIPQPFKLESTAAAYLTFAATASQGHSGIGFLKAEYTGAPSSGKQETAKLTIPKVNGAQGDKFWFALRAPTVADAGCGNDDFVVKIAGKEVYRRCNALANWQTISVDLPAGQTVDVELSVVTGFGATTKGVWELDDIGVAGKCTYACFSADFDNGQSLSSQWTTAAKEPAVWKPWALNTTVFKSGKTSVFNTYGGTKLPKDKTENTMITKANLYIPVIGAAWSYNLNLFVETPDCPNAMVQKMRLIISQSIVLDPKAALGDADGNVTLDSHCQSTTGWQAFGGDLEPKTWGKMSRIFFGVHKEAKNKSLNAYVDDVLLMCK